MLIAAIPALGLMLLRLMMMPGLFVPPYTTRSGTVVDDGRLGIQSEAGTGPVATDELSNLVQIHEYG